MVKQAVVDTYSGGSKERHELTYWLASKDFFTVCDYACLPARELREQIRMLLKLPQSLCRKYGKELARRIA